MIDARVHVRWRIAMLVMVFTVFALHAAEVTALQAKDAVQSWLADAPSLGCRLGGTVEGVRTCSATNGTPFHVVRIAGGGFVVTSADTLLEPIIAFSSAGDLVENDSNPLWVLLKGDFAERGKSVVLASGHRMRAGAGMSSAALRSMALASICTFPLSMASPVRPSTFSASL